MLLWEEMECSWTFVGRAIVVALADPGPVAAVEVGRVRVAEYYLELPLDEGPNLFPTDVRELVCFQVGPELSCEQVTFLSGSLH